MIQKTSVTRLTLMLVALIAMAWATSAQAQSTKFLLTPGPTAAPYGGQLQIGTGLPLPVGTAGIFVGGMQTMTPATPSNAVPIPFPPLFIPPVANIMSPGATRHIIQNQSTANGGAISIPPAVISMTANGTPVAIGVFNTNPVVYQVATTISYSWPSSTVVFQSGGAPGPVVLPGPPTANGVIVYSGGTKSFGGPGTFSIAAGPGAGTYAIPDQGTPTTPNHPIATVFLNAGGVTPGAGMAVALVGASNPLGMAAQGASVAAATASTNFLGVPNGVRTVNIPIGGGGCTMWCVGTNGTIGLTPTLGSTWSQGPGMGGTGPSNRATSTKGFPWTTGFITVSQPAATGMPEKFILRGTDNRVAGVGNIQLVAGSLSQRMLSQANANRAWLSLPEPTAALGTAAALGMLALCHGIVRRRNR